MAKNTDFDRTEIIRQLSIEDRFSLDEVGLTHPNTNAYVKLCNDGSVEIYAGNDTGVFMNPNTKTITFMADKVKFITNNENGICWNDKELNSQATSFTEPALVPIESRPENGAYRDFSNYIRGVDNA